jgi:hypothetical protein
MIYHNTFTVLLALIGICLCSSCNPEEKSGKYASETKQFNSYLKERFSTSLPSDTNTYVLLSSSGCSGCVKSFLKALTQPRSSQAPKVHFIVPNKLLIKNDLDAAILNNAVMIDVENKIDRLPYHRGNIAIIESTKGRIYNWYKIEPYQTDSILTMLIKKGI